MKISYNILKYIFLYRYNRRSGEINASFGTTKVACSKVGKLGKVSPGSATIEHGDTFNVFQCHLWMDSSHSAESERERMNHSTVARPINSRRMGTCSSRELERKIEISNKKWNAALPLDVWQRYICHDLS